MPINLLNNIRVTLQAAPGTLVLTGPEGEEQALDGVQHVSVLKPFNQHNGGPNPNNLYRLRGVSALTRTPVDLQGMRFGGFSGVTGAARFADQ